MYATHTWHNDCSVHGKLCMAKEKHENKKLHMGRKLKGNSILFVYWEKVIYRRRNQLFLIVNGEKPKGSGAKLCHKVLKLSRRNKLLTSKGVEPYLWFTVLFAGGPYAV